MSDLAVRVENISKIYRLGLAESKSDTAILGLARLAAAPVRNVMRLWKLSHFDKSHYEEDTIWALRDVSFEVFSGEVIGIIGPNGAGKSTLLKILSRITEPTAGRIDLYGRVSSLLEVGTGFHPELTGRENTYLNGTILGMRKREIDARFDEIVDFSGIEKFLDTPVKRYSSGMRVRLAFAVAAHLEPEILIIDEVLAVGDWSFQRKCLGKMSEVAKGGRTVIFVSHQLGLVRSLCRRCLLFLDGMKTLDGEVSAVIDAYREMVAGEEASESTEFRVETPMRFPLEVRSGRLMGEDSRKKAIFDVFEDILIELDYEVAERVDGAMVEFDVVSRGNTLLLSYDTDESPERMGAREPGCYKARIKLPSGLLKPGRYSISVGTGQLKRRQYQVVENALNFEVEVRTRPPAFLSFHKKRRGLLAMPLQWDTESAEDGALRADAFPATDAGE